jgi:hypothetical protein
VSVDAINRSHPEPLLGVSDARVLDALAAASACVNAWFASAGSWLAK